MRRPITIGRHTAVLWTMRTDHALDEQRAAFCLNLLAPEEQERYRRLPGGAQRQLSTLRAPLYARAL